MTNTPKCTWIYIVGPDSTGKTTLCNALSTRLNLPKASYVQEVARQVMKQSGFTRENVYMVETQQAILNAQLRQEDEAKKSLEGEIVLCDRSAVDPIVYAVLTAPTPEEAQVRKDMLLRSEGFPRRLEEYKSAKSIFVLLEPVKEWLVEDGIRLLDQQDNCLEVFREVLNGLGIPYQTMGAETRSLDERVAIVMSLGRL